MAYLYLIPTTLSTEAIHTLPDYTVSRVHSLSYFVAEKAKTARQFIKECKHPKPIAELDIRELNKHSDHQDWSYLFEALSKGEDMGLVSEAGCPGVADPGAEGVAWAHKQGHTVVPMVGPSSILLALMASGMNGQNFCFLGELPNKQNELKLKLRHIESVILKSGQSQIFIETPYRNEALIKHILDHFRPDIKFCVASDLTGKDEMIISKSISEWKKLKAIKLHKIPSIFILGK